MPNTRVMLWVAFAAILYLNYEAWMHDYREPAPSTAASTVASSPAAGAPAASNSLADSIPKAGSAAPQRCRDRAAARHRAAARGFRCNAARGD